MLMTVYLLRQEINIKEITMNLFEEYKKSTVQQKCELSFEMLSILAN